MQEVTKACSKCSIQKNLDCFQKDSNPKKAGRFGCKSYCKECAKSLRRSYYLRHKDKEYENHKEWVKNNRGILNSLHNKYYKENPKKFNDRTKKRYNETKGFCNVVEYYKKNEPLMYASYTSLLRDNRIIKRRKNSANYKSKNKEQVQASNKNRYYKNWIRQRMYADIYRLAFPNKIKEQRKRRVAELRDGYIADQMARTKRNKASGVDTAIIKSFPKIIELRRHQIKVKRILKDK
jgi:hypothetical protein